MGILSLVSVKFVNYTSMPAQLPLLVVLPPLPPPLFPLLRYMEGCWGSGFLGEERKASGAH